MRGQTAVVTGGGRGLGRAFAIGLAASGARVAAVARTGVEVAETAAMIRENGGQAIGLTADVTDAAEVNGMIARVERELGPVDLLVNGAGYGRPFGPFWESDPAEWWRNVEVNLKGPMLCSRAVLPGMIARRRGRIVNVASGAGAMCIPYMSAYVSSKCAVIRFSEVLAAEVREHGVSVFAIQPGTVRTAMAEDLLAAAEGQRWLPWFQRIFDEGRDDTMEPGTELVLYLASGAADALSGRFFQAPGDPGEAVARTREVLERDLLALRLTR